MSSEGAVHQEESSNIFDKEGGSSVSVDLDSDCCHQDEDQLGAAKCPMHEDRTEPSRSPFGLPEDESHLPTVDEETKSSSCGQEIRRKERHRSASVRGHSSVKSDCKDVGARSFPRRGSDDVPSLQQKSHRRDAPGKSKKTTGKHSGDTPVTPKRGRDLEYRDKKYNQAKKTRKPFRSERDKKVAAPSLAEQPCRLVIKPPSELPVKKDVVTLYLKECLGDEITFYHEETKKTDGGCLEFTFVFQNNEQGRRAELILKENIREAGEKIEVSILTEGARTDMILVECLAELQKKMTEIEKQHTVKIEKISSHIKALRVQKHIALNEFEKICSERKVLEHKKEELESQLREFRRFELITRSTLDAQRRLPPSCVEPTVKKLREAFGRECRRIAAALPMYAKKTEIVQLIEENQVCVILGETGSGKSTQMTQYLYEAGFAEKGLIVCTQPRKVAATSLAFHVAREMGSTVGKVVGCRVGGNVQASKETTGILYATDHILLNECLKDPQLSKYSCIIIDEAHERSLYSDLLLGMIKKSLIQRPELRVVITSATIDPALFVAYFDQCPVLKVSGRMFPVDVIWKDGPSCNVENYLQEAVKTAREIHHREDPGDILVFLTSPAETERACEMLTKVERDANLVCLPLHGKLRQEEQKKVFEEDGDKRKVVFATNCAETSITIPGIKYVVDTGMVKEMKFEPKRNKSSLEVTTINKSSAEQRKGRAGRTQAGKCFRLYSKEEYEAMEDQSKPEILRVHLGQAVLKLMELGIEDVRDFDFVESPPFDSITLALELLNSLGAITNGKLTQLGGKIARVPVEPRLAKVIFEGIEKGVGADALALAAIATAGGSVFFRMGSEEEKQAADSRKVGFCLNGGDLLTLLEVYRQYLKQPKDLPKRKKWAVANSLNAKSLRMTDETIKELKLTLKHELEITIPNTLQKDENTDVKLQKILFSCYATNLCLFTGHEKKGYRVLSSDQCVQVHPSSALKFLGATPQFIVFDQLLKTSRDFVVNVTPVEETWLREMISTGALKYDLENLLSTVLTEMALPCSPELIKLTFGGYKRKKVDQIEDKVSKSCDDSLVVLEEDKERGQIKIFVPPRYTAKALSVIESILEESRKILRSEEREEPLREESQGSRMVWGQGGEIRELLMLDMYRTVTVGKIEDGYSAAVLDHLRSFGDIVKHSLREQNGKMRVFVTYRDSQDALKAVNSPSNSCSDINIKVQPSNSTGDGNQLRFSQFKVKVKWLRRPGKGTGSVQFFHGEDFFYTLGRISSLIIKSKRVIFQVDKIHNQQIFMRRLHPETSEEDVTSAIEEKLPSVKVMKVFIHRIAEFETADETLVVQKTLLEESLSSFAAQGEFSVYVGKPSTKSFEGYAHLTFQNPEEGEAAIRGLNGMNIPGIGMVTLHPNLSTVLSCARNVYEVIEDEFMETISELESTFEANLIIKVKNKPTDQRVLIEIQSESTEHFISATTVLTEIFNGDKIDCKISKDLEILLTNSAKDVLRTIQKDTGTVISQDWKNRAVRIHGPEANRESAKRAINKFLDDSITGNRHSWQIQLRGPNKPRGLLKALFKRFGVNLQGLRDINGVQKIHVEFRNHVLKIESSDEAEELINSYVEECCKNLSQELFPLQQDHQTQLTCGICLCDLDSTADVYRLSCCGHAYDKSCVIQQLKSPDFPLKCVVEKCGERLVWKDLQNLLNDRERKRLALTALDEYVKRNPEIVKYCPTANCGMVYRVSTNGRSFTCDACLAQTCTSCHVQWHDGLTCAMFKSEKQVEGRLVEWMMKDPSNRKKCPKCKTPIEKNQGCNHMECSQCRSHMCWLCLQMFPTGSDVYDHQRHCLKKTEA